MDDEEGDVVIVGASFAGLATARFLEDAHVLILERKKRLGISQRSTCCTSLSWMDRLGCPEAVLQSFDHLTMHSSGGVEARIRLPETFCTIDYNIFCNSLSEKLDNTSILLGKKALKIGGGEVSCQNESFKGRIVVDASGWPNLNEKEVYKAKGRPAFGLEIETEYSGDMDSFHIYYGKKFITRGYAWVFPTAEDRARIGLGGFVDFNPQRALDHFITQIGVDRNGQRPHGGYLPLFGLGSAQNNGAFLVGDAANQIIPASGEGIRTAFEFSFQLSEIIGRILAGEISNEEGLEEYRGILNDKRDFYRNLRFIQDLATYCPDWARNRIIRTLSQTDSKKPEQIIKSYLDSNITSSRRHILKIVLRGLGHII